MKLLRSRIENFGLFRDVEFDFATASDRKLTIIRAANGGGKTTLLNALQWGLFGDHALPKGGANFRLGPLNAAGGDRSTIVIRVEIDYEVQTRAGASQYRLIRSVTERVVEGEPRRCGTNVSLLRFTPEGSVPVENAEATVRPHLALELRDVFFTDGDKALTFVEGSTEDAGTNPVKAATQSLLGFEVITKALGHLERVGSDINQSIQRAAGNQSDLERATGKLLELQQATKELEETLQQTSERRINLENLERESDAKYAEAVRRGNREDLENQRQSAIRGRQAALKDTDDAAGRHAALFRSELLGKHFLAKHFKGAKRILDTLHSQGKIPNQAIPVLQDRLDQPACICGERLDGDGLDEKRRREHIQHLIEDSRNADEIQEKITALYYRAQELLEPVEDDAWVKQYRKIYGQRQRAEDRAKKHGQDEREAEAIIASLPNVDTQKLLARRNRYRDQSRDAYGKEIDIKGRLERARRELEAEEKVQRRLLQHSDRGKKLAAELEVAGDLRRAMGSALEVMRTRELVQVSECMNSLFLEMIGMDGGDEDDASQRLIIARAWVTPDFRIVVSGPRGQLLDLSQHLNGASRRALAIAFVLAVTNVSKFEAPNVIDTPLGMTSGYIRTAILQVAAQRSFQLLMFLTHDEIKGCEDILDKYAGQVYTLTNPAHYPKILINDPGVADTRILVCKCNHRQSCETCELREKVDMDVALSPIPQREGEIS